MISPTSSPVSRRRRPSPVQAITALGFPGGGFSGPAAPLQIVKKHGRTCSLYSIAADPYVTVATGVSQWSDISGNGRNFLQSNTAKQPSYLRADPTLANRGSITGDGSDDLLSASSLVLPAPSVSPVYMYGVFKCVSEPGAIRQFFQGSTTVFDTIRFRTTNTPTTWAQANGSSDQFVPLRSTGVWYRIMLGFTGSTLDFLTVGESSSTGVNTGDNPPDSLHLFGNGLDAGFTNCAFAMIMVVSGISSLGHSAFNLRTDLDLWVKKYYFGAVVI